LKTRQFAPRFKPLMTVPPDPSRALKCLAHAFGPAAARARLEAPIDGAINRTYPIALDGARCALRLRVDEAGFRYEKGVAKSALVGTIHAAKRAGADDKSAAEAKPDRIAPPHAPALAHWSNGDEAWPLPWEVARWCPGRAVGAPDFAPPEAALARAAAAIAEIHAVAFEGGVADLRDLDGPKIGFADWIGGAIERELARGPVAARIEGYARDIARSAGGPVRWTLVHNDLHGLHLIHDPATGGIGIIDWDNALIAPAELDFVKLKHWTKIDPLKGCLSFDFARYVAISSAYAAHIGSRLDADVFRACETLWLLRVWRFESDRRAAGRPTPKLFAGPDIYRAALDRLAIAA
jgi:aminoglycoside phosphotransferase (APT) family kinase protein